MHVPLADILGSVPTPAFVLVPDQDGAPVFSQCNSAWFELLNLTPENAYGRTIADVVPGVEGEGTLRMHLQAMAARKPVRYTVAVPVGRSFATLKTTLTPIRHPDGSLQCLFGTTFDITNEAQSQIIEMRYEGLAREIDSLSAYLSETLLNQLHRVSEVATELIDGFVDLGDGKLETLTQIETGAQVAAAMVTEVLDRARATRVAADTDLFELASIFEHEAKTLRTNFVMSVSSDGQQVLADRETVRVIFRNLLFTSGAQSKNDL